MIHGVVLVDCCSDSSKELSDAESKHDAVHVIDITVVEEDSKEIFLFLEEWIVVELASFLVAYSICTLLCI